jgi:hypothetical protein
MTGSWVAPRLAPTITAIAEMDEDPYSILSKRSSPSDGSFEQIGITTAGTGLKDGSARRHHSAAQ